MSGARYSSLPGRSSISTRIPAVWRSAETNQPVKSGLRSSAVRSCRLTRGSAIGGCERRDRPAPLRPPTTCLRIRQAEDVAYAVEARDAVGQVRDEREPAGRKQVRVVTASNRSSSLPKTSLNAV